MTATADLCEHGMPPAGCAACLAPTPTQEPMPPVIVNRITATADSTCDGCHTPIWTGQTVVRLSDDSVRHELLGCLS